MDRARILPSADVDERAALGPGTTIWHLAQVRENARWAATASSVVAPTWALA